MNSYFLHFPLLLLLATFTAQAELPYRIGILLPLSGQTAYIGSACRNGADLAMQSLNPDLRKNLQVVYEDDQMQARSALSGLKKMLVEGPLTAVVSMSSGTSNALAPITEEAKIPLIAIASDPQVVAGRSYAVNYWVTPEEEARALRAELQRRGMKKVAIVTGNHAAFMTFKREFLREPLGEFEILLDENFDPGEMDFRSVLTKLKRLPELDGIFVNLFFGQVGPFTRQARSLGISAPFFGIENFEDEKEVSASAGALLGQWYIQADDGQSSFIRKYHAKYPDAPTFFAGNCHDAILLLAQAYKEGRDRQGVNNLLHNIKNFEGAFGTVSARGDNRFDLKAVVKKVTKKGFEKL